MKDKYLNFSDFRVQNKQQRTIRQLDAQRIPEEHSSSFQSTRIQRAV